MKIKFLALLFLYSFVISCQKEQVTKKEIEIKKTFKNNPINHLNLIPIKTSIKDETFKSDLTKTVIRNIAQNKQYELNIGDLNYGKTTIPVYQMKIDIEKKNSLYNITARILDPVNQVLVKKAINKSVEYDSLIRITDELIRRILATEKIMEND